MSDHLSAARIDALLDRELDARAEQAALEHLLTCRDCRETHGALVEAATLAGLAAPPASPTTRGRAIRIGAAAAAALALVAAYFAFRPTRESVPPDGPEAPGPGHAVVVHSLIITTTRESDGIVSRDTRRVETGGDFERSRERIRPAGEGRVFLAMRRGDNYGGPSR